MIRRAGVVLGLIAVFAGCSKKDAGTTDTGMAMTTDTGAVAQMADTGMAPAPGLTDPNIVYILDNANKLDSAAGSIASTKGTNAEVRDFGKRMMRDHHSLRQQGQELATKLGVTPAPPANDDSQAQYDKTMSMLNGAAKGKDFDKAYIDNEVAYHKAVNAALKDTLIPSASNAELKDLLGVALKIFEGHLQHAEHIAASLK